MSALAERASRACRRPSTSEDARTSAARPSAIGRVILDDRDADHGSLRQSTPAGMATLATAHTRRRPVGPDGFDPWHGRIDTPPRDQATAGRSWHIRLDNDD